MKPHLKVVLATALLALSASPAFAHGKPEGTPANGKGHSPSAEKGGPEYAPPEDTTPGPKAGLPEKAKAYGRNCKDESKQHVKGEKGTPFSQCVTAMAKAANHQSMSPGRACRELSRKHVKGEKGTPFSQCVKGVVQLRKEEKEKAAQEEGS
jgi:hypothetical protein